MRRFPEPRTDGGPDRPHLGLAQRAIVLRAQALWSSFQPLYDRLCFALAVGDDRALKRLIDPLNALAKDMADCQELLFRAWGIDDVDDIAREIAAVEDRTPQATAIRAAAIQRSLDSAADIVARAEALGLTKLAEGLRYSAKSYRDMAESVLPPLPAVTEQKDLTFHWHIRQSFEAIRLAAATARASVPVEVAEARQEERRRGEAQNLQNEPGSDTADGAPPPRSDPACHGPPPASASRKQQASKQEAQTPPADMQPSGPRFREAPLAPRPDQPKDFQSLYRETFQRQDQEWTPPPRERSWNEPLFDPGPLMDNRFTSATPGYDWFRRKRRP